MRPSGGWRDSACPHTPGMGQRWKYCGVRVGGGLLRPALGTSGASAPSPHVKARGAAQGELLGVGPCDRVSLVGVLPTGARSPGGTSAQSPGLLGYAASGCGQGRANCGGEGPGGAGAAPSRPAGGVCGAGTGSLQPGRKAARKGQETESLRRATACHFRHSRRCLRPRPPRGPGELAPVCRVPWARQL